MGASLDILPQWQGVTFYAEGTFPDGAQWEAIVDRCAERDPKHLFHWEARVIVSGAPIFVARGNAKTPEEGKAAAARSIVKLADLPRK